MNGPPKYSRHDAVSRGEESEEGGELHFRFGDFVIFQEIKRARTSLS